MARVVKLRIPLTYQLLGYLAHPVILMPYPSIRSSRRVDHPISKFLWEQNGQSKSAINKQTTAQRKRLLEKVRVKYQEEITR